MHASLVSRDLNVTAAFLAATATRRIYTPWPISLGHMGFAMLMTAFQLYRLRYRSAPRITVWFLLYVINFTLSIGSVVYSESALGVASGVWFVKRGVSRRR